MTIPTMLAVPYKRGIKATESQRWQAPGRQVFADAQDVHEDTFTVKTQDRAFRARAGSLMVMLAATVDGHDAGRGQPSGHVHGHRQRRGRVAGMTVPGRGESRGKVAAGPNPRRRHRASPRPYFRCSTCRQFDENWRQYGDRRGREW